MINKPNRIRLMVVDDNDLLCGSLERWFERSPGVEFLGYVTDGPSAAEEVVRLQPDIVLLDVDIPKRSGMDILKTIVAKRPQTRIVMLSGHLKREYIQRALDLGAHGYILKDVRIPELAEMITKAANGEQVLCQASLAAMRGVDEAVILASP
jgi:two-component system NarL family response regulator